MKTDEIELQQKKLKEDPESKSSEPININANKDLSELTKPDNKKNMILFGIIGIIYADSY